MESGSVANEGGFSPIPSNRALTVVSAKYSELRSIDSIIVGERHRRDLGKLELLAQSIAAIGLLHPITIDAKGNLLAGVRRVAACKLLGWTEIPVMVVRT